MNEILEIGGVTIVQGDALRSLAAFPDQSVHCCVTSPPYFGLRDYGMAGQMGLESTPQEYVDSMTGLFREVRRVLRDDGTLWLNLGDSYANDTKWGGATGGKHAGGLHGATGIGRQKTSTGLKAKDLIGIPWRVAFALQADGWYLRQDIIWAKPNPMPESVRDRCTKSHEYIFLLAKSEKYYYDCDAIKTTPKESSIARLSQPNLENQAGSPVPGKTNGPMRAVFGGRKKHAGHGHHGHEDQGAYLENGVNKRDVWTVPFKPLKDAHFATFPPDLIEPCILAGCPAGGIVLDPFGGSGTTGMVAQKHGRQAVLLELNPEYVAIAERRITGATIQ